MLGREIKGRGEGKEIKWEGGRNIERERNRMGRERVRERGRKEGRQDKYIEEKQGKGETTGGRRKGNV